MKPHPGNPKIFLKTLQLQVQSRRRCRHPAACEVFRKEISSVSPPLTAGLWLCCRLAEDRGPEETGAAAAGWAGHTGQQARRAGQGPGRPGKRVSYLKTLNTSIKTLSCTAGAPVVSQTSPRSCGRRESSASLPCGAPARVGSLPGHRRQVKGQNVAPGTGPLHRWCSGVHRGTSCFTCLPLTPTPPRDIWPFDLLPSAGPRRRTSTWRGRWSRTKARWPRKRRSASFSDCQQTQPTNVADKRNVSHDYYRSFYLIEESRHFCQLLESLWGLCSGQINRRDSAERRGPATPLHQLFTDSDRPPLFLFYFFLNLNSALLSRERYLCNKHEYVWDEGSAQPVCSSLRLNVETRHSLWWIWGTAQQWGKFYSYFFSFLFLSPHHIQKMMRWVDFSVRLFKEKQRDNIALFKLLHYLTVSFNYLTFYL